LRRPLLFKRRKLKITFQFFFAQFILIFFIFQTQKKVNLLLVSSVQNGFGNLSNLSAR
jgi:hypothetical protein